MPRLRQAEDGSWEMYREDKDCWNAIHPLTRDIVEALKADPTFEEIVDNIDDYDPKLKLDDRRMKAKQARKSLRRLWKLGHVQFDLPAPDDTLRGRYEKVELLGRGGLGEAWLYEDQELGGEPVVVKRPWGLRSHIQNGQRTLYREIRAFETLDHPNLPEMHESFSHDGLLHLVRGYVQGRPLNEWARDRNLAPEKDDAFRDALRGVARALHRFHIQGFLYLDGSPNNFVVDPRGDIVIYDLGAVTPFQDGRASLPGARGTRGYQAPEAHSRVPGEKERPYEATVRSEVYTFGCMLHKLVVGSRPSGKWYEDDFEEALEEADVHPVHREVITACTRDDPAERPADMPAVIDLLEEAWP